MSRYDHAANICISDDGQHAHTPLWGAWQYEGSGLWVRYCYVARWCESRQHYIRGTMRNVEDTAPL